MSSLDYYRGTREKCPNCWTEQYVTKKATWSVHSYWDNGVLVECVNSRVRIDRAVTGR